MKRNSFFTDDDENLTAHLNLAYQSLCREGSISFWQQFPKTEIWRFFVETKRQPQGILAFEVLEKNYFEGLFSDLVAHIDSEQEDYCNHQSYCARHQTCTQNVIKTGKLKQYAYFHPFQPGKYRDELSGEIRYELIISTDEDATCTRAGLEEILAQIKQGKIHCSLNQWDRQALQNQNITQLASSLFAMKKIFLGTEIDKNNQPEIKINEFFAEYKDEVKRAHSKYEVVMSMAKLMISLQRSHYFYDRNAMCNFRLLMDLCIQNELPPPMMKNVNIFEGFSLKECVHEIIQGAKRSLAMLIENSPIAIKNKQDTQRQYKNLSKAEKKYFNHLVESIESKQRNCSLLY